jgi:hypothetical protein
VTSKRELVSYGTLSLVIWACGGRAADESYYGGCDGDGDVVCECSDGQSGIAECLADGTVGTCDCDSPSTRPGSTGGGGASGGKGAKGSGGTSVSKSGTSNLGGTTSSTDTTSAAGAGASVNSTCVTRGITHQVVDADYSDALDRIVLLTSTPNAVVLLNPHTNESLSVALPLLGASISLSPNGRQAAVAHDGHLSVVDLETATITKTISTTTVSGDVVMGGNGYAYLLPESDQWVGLHSVEIATSIDHGDDDRWQIYAGTLAKLHPSGTAIYGITVGLSPTDLERYDISAGVVGTVVDSPYHGDYSMCGDLWISKDGMRIFTGCGTAFRAAPGTKDDMTYSGKLEDPSSTSTPYLPRYQSIAHDAKNGKIYAIPANASFASSKAPVAAEATVEVFGYEYLSFETARAIPCMRAGEKDVTMYGRYVFAAAAGDYVYVLAKSAEAGLLQPWGVASLATK